MSENASVQAWATPCARGTGRTSALSGPTRKVSAAKSDSLGRAEIEGASQAQDGECPCRLRRSSNARVPAIGEEIAVDGTDLAAFANGQRFLWRAGRERQRHSDPDASWGHRSGSVQPERRRLLRLQAAYGRLRSNRTSARAASTNCATQRFPVCRVAARHSPYSRLPTANTRDGQELRP
jgi:hypothetical protein